MEQLLKQWINFDGGKFAGKSFNEICDMRRDMTIRYSKLHMTLTGQDTDILQPSKYNEVALTNIYKVEDLLVGKLNNVLESNEIRFRLSSLEENICIQMLSFYTEELMDVLVKEVSKYVKLLCSENVIKKFEKEFISQYVDGAKEEILKSISKDEFDEDDTNIIKDIKELQDYMDTSTQDLIKTIKSEIELEIDVKENSPKEQVDSKPIKEKKEESKVVEQPKQQPVKEETQKKVQEEKVQGPVKGKDNFVPEAVQDVDFEEVNPIESLKKELKNKIEECTTYYYNENRVLAMIGNQKHLLNEVMGRILEMSKSMDDLLDNISEKDTKESLLSKLSVIQVDLATMINSYNPNITKDHTSILNSFKTVEVDAQGNPTVYEDYFGQKITLEDIMYARRTPDSSLDFNNDKILKKYPEIAPLVYKVQEETGVDVKLLEVKSPYKYMNPIIQAFVFAKDRDLYRPFFIDINSTIYNNKKKIMLAPSSGIIEDGYIFDIENVDLLIKYIKGDATKTELEQQDMIVDELRSLNKILDIASIHPENRARIIEVLSTEQGEETLDLALKADIDTRFRLNKWVNQDNFELLSDSRGRKSFLEPSCKRKKQIITVKDKTIILSK